MGSAAPEALTRKDQVGRTSATKLEHFSEIQTFDTSIRCSKYANIVRPVNNVFCEAWSQFDTHMTKVHAQSIHSKVLRTLL